MVQIITRYFQFTYSKSVFCIEEIKLVYSPTFSNVDLSTVYLASQPKLETSGGVGLWLSELPVKEKNKFTIERTNKTERAECDVSAKNSKAGYFIGHLCSFQVCIGEKRSFVCDANI